MAELLVNPAQLDAMRRLFNDGERQPGPFDHLTAGPSLYGVQIRTSPALPHGRALYGPDANGHWAILDLGEPWLFTARRQLQEDFARLRSTLARLCPLTCPPEWSS